MLAESGRECVSHEEALDLAFVELAARDDLTEPERDLVECVIPHARLRRSQPLEFTVQRGLRPGRGRCRPSLIGAHPASDVHTSRPLTNIPQLQEIIMKANQLLLAATLVSAIGFPLGTQAEEKAMAQQTIAKKIQILPEGEMPFLGGATGWLNSAPLTAAGLRC